MNPTIVVAALIEDQGKVLIARRATGTLAGKWEFPGGKVLPNESNQDGLAREIREELQIQIVVGHAVKSVAFNIEEKAFELHGYLAKISAGEISLVEHDRSAWAFPEELLSYDLAPADIPIAKEYIKL